jgi:hypothetical protein
VNITRLRASWFQENRNTDPKVCVVAAAALDAAVAEIVASCTFLAPA